MPVVEIAHTSQAEALAGLARATFSETFGHLYPPADLATFLERYTAAHFADLIADPAQQVWVARDGAHLVGYAHAGPCSLPHAEVTPTCGEVKRLYVLQSAQKGGLGSALLEVALVWLATPGRQLWIGVWSENDGAQRLYGRYGFHKVGEYDFIVGETRDREFILRRNR